jgi:hypothetical protein
MKVLIGSRAMKYWFGESYNRIPHDIDYFSTDKVEGAETFWHPKLSEYKWQHDGIATPIELYTIKVSHAFWFHGDRKWWKHMYDVKFLQDKGYGYIVPELYDILYAIWEERHGKKKAFLNTTPEDFFNPSVHRIYDHDSIHASIAYYDRPLFEKILKDGADVMVDKGKFDALVYEDKLKLVREEVYATALERVLIPKNYVPSPRAAYNYAMRKTITSFSKGWFPLFIVLHWSELYKPDVDYLRIHLDNKDKLITL